MNSFLFAEVSTTTPTSQPSLISANIKTNGVVYTPEFLADFVAKKVLSLYFGNFSRNKYPATLRVLDPACGNGELLLAISRQYSDFISINGIHSSITLFGTELDASAAEKTTSRLRLARQLDSEIICTNALLPFDAVKAHDGWRNIGQQWGIEDGFDIIIANPPWGADTSNYSSKLLNGGYNLSKGQFDTSDLFVELSLSLVKRNGFIAFIIPDSLFSDERVALRGLLLNTNIKFIGRLGEKIFKGINRGCVVIICEVVDKSNVANNVSCLRLTPATRQAVLRNNFSLNEIDEIHSHDVPQKRFLENPNHRFDIDFKQGSDFEILTTGSSFRDFLKSTRGVELSKNGKVCQCHSCKQWVPYPRSNRIICKHCQSEIDPSASENLLIIKKAKGYGNKPIIVGENIQRYSLSGNLWIADQMSGINYKSTSIYKGPKILVRKTGVGISATVDYSNSLTNQVVYIYSLINAASVLPLEFFLGILNSRLIYYFTVKKYGETEWRSHPYVTQNQILDIPLPCSKTLTSNLTLVDEIARLVRTEVQLGGPISHISDARIEYLVGKLYGLSQDDYKIIYHTLEQIENLLPVRQLKSVTVKDIFG